MGIWGTRVGLAYFDGFDFMLFCGLFGLVIWWFWVAICSCFFGFYLGLRSLLCVFCGLDWIALFGVLWVFDLCFADRILLLLEVCVWIDCCVLVCVLGLMHWFAHCMLTIIGFGSVCGLIIGFLSFWVWCGFGFGLLECF